MIRNRCDSKRMAIKYKQVEATGKQKKKKRVGKTNKQIETIRKDWRTNKYG